MSSTGTPIPPPSQEEVQRKMDELHKEQSYYEALEYLYSVSTQLSYIQEERLKLNIIYEPFTVPQFKQAFQITINRSKPEIIQPTQNPPNGAPPPPSPTSGKFLGECQICFENVASEHKPGLRVWEFSFNGRSLFLQFPPFPYFKLHSCITERKHTPQIIGEVTVQDLLDICEMMEGYSVGSNTDKLGTGATNLAHRHYQAGLHEFPIYQCAIRKVWRTSVPETSIEWLDHPATSVCVVGPKQGVKEVCMKLLQGWREGEFDLRKDVQTISWLARRKGSVYRVIMIPRNGDNPRFLTRPSLQSIKKEFLGIFEMVGYAILPGRLAEQLPLIEQRIEQSALQDRTSCLQNDEGLKHFQTFVNDFVLKHFTATTSVHQAMTLGLQDAFLTIIQDNSPLKYHDEEGILKWLKESHIDFRASNI